jgi:outer membrane protein OmpA-like peptidoglycan-associated protein
MMTRWFWAALAALVVMAIGLIFWQTGKRSTVVPPVAQSPPVAPAARTVAQGPASSAAAPAAEKEPAAASSAPTVAQAPSTNAAAPTAEKKPTAPPSATTAEQAPSTNAAASTGEKESAMTAPMETQTPATNATPKARENDPATKPDELASEANTKATAELASLKPSFSAKDLVAALNDSVINFRSGSAELPASIASFLQNAAEDLKRMPAGYVLEITGYTDNTGDAAKNVGLSQRRADAVREALAKSGANADMLVAKGHGSADPIASNDTHDGRLRNRRIEYRVLKTPDKH